MVSGDTEHGLAGYDVPSVRPETAVCAIDLGSRNFKAVVGRIAGGAVVARLLDKVRMDLGEHLAENCGFVSEAMIAEIRESVDTLAARGRAEGASEVLAVGTRALREARNAGAVVRAAQEVGVEIEWPPASGRRSSPICARPGVCRIGSSATSAAIVSRWHGGRRTQSIRDAWSPATWAPGSPGSPALRDSLGLAANTTRSSPEASTVCPGERSSSSASHPTPRHRMCSGGRRRRSPIARSRMLRWTGRFDGWRDSLPSRGARIATRFRGPRRYCRGSWRSTT